MGIDNNSLKRVLRAIKDQEPLHGPTIIPSDIPVTEDELNYLMQEDLLAMRSFGFVVFATGLSAKGSALLAEMDADND